MWIREPMHLSTSSNGSSVEPDIAPARLLRGPARCWLHALLLWTE
jgi:hypothetical protein